ncbi:hypothetical protein [Granulicella arctica]|uniref:hypothetical protein n=1 Tax=Granulicella arctica TaxID=940613 RepID=UPI0021E0D648|nr:hypothetical protein [Granulicella arctica]
MKRTPGLILSAITLGIFAVGMLLFTALIVASGFFMRNHPTTPAPHPFVLPVLLAAAFFFLAVAIWSTCTVVGLLFLRPWSRYSVLILGGLLTAGGVLSLLGIATVLLSGQLLPPSGSQSPTTVAYTHLIFAVIAVFYAFVAAVGTVWLVYFNRRTTRELFVHRARIDESTGLILPPPDPSRRPTAITIIACLSLMGAVCCLIMAFIPLPAFFMGIIFEGMPSHALYAGLAIVSALIGIGLLRLNPAARIATMAAFAVGTINTLMTFLPWYQARFRAYTEQFSARLSLPVPNTVQAIHQANMQLMIYGIFGIILYGYLIWLLHRHRTAFTEPPPLQAAV